MSSSRQPGRGPRMQIQRGQRRGLVIGVRSCESCRGRGSTGEVMGNTRSKTTFWGRLQYHGHLKFSTRSIGRAKIARGATLALRGICGTARKQTPFHTFIRLIGKSRSNLSIKNYALLAIQVQIFLYQYYSLFKRGRGQQHRRDGLGFYRWG